MTPLPIVWQRLVAENGKTCPRCDGTFQQIERAIATLRESLRPLGIDPVLEVKEIGDETFRKNPSESNRIWIGGRPLEDWLGATSGSSQCCSVCGDLPCRTTELGGTVYEEVPQELILRAGLMAASQVLQASPPPCDCAAPSACCAG